MNASPFSLLDTIAHNRCKVQLCANDSILLIQGTKQLERDKFRSFIPQCPPSSMLTLPFQILSQATCCQTFSNPTFSCMVSNNIEISPAMPLPAPNPTSRHASGQPRDVAYYRFVRKGHRCLGIHLFGNFSNYLGLN